MNSLMRAYSVGVRLDEWVDTVSVRRVLSNDTSPMVLTDSCGIAAAERDRLSTAPILAISSSKANGFVR